MSADAYRAIISASEEDRLDLFLSAANRLGTPVGNVEKDFWVCWVLDVLYHRLPAERPRLLFKGGTSLSKAYHLIERFSEDIDITIFRQDIGQPASIEDLQVLSKRRRKARLDAIRDSCRQYVTGSLLAAVSAELAGVAADAGHVEIDAADPDGQTLLVWYPAVKGPDSGHLRRAIRIEAGAKSALDPSNSVNIRPYVSEELPELELSVPDVTTIKAERTFWDKVVIAHGLRRWFERRGELRHEGQQISRHYYDLHCLLNSKTGAAAIKDLALAEDCVSHARMFFDRADYDLETAVHGTYAVAPAAGMIDGLKRDYDRTTAMIFGEPPPFDEVMQSVESLAVQINRD